MIAVIDYGMGNIHSVQKALEKTGANAIITSRAGDIEASAKVVLPGVGAFADAMIALEERGLVAAIRTHIANGRPFLGICLGMQLLFDGSEEAPKTAGLGIIPGTVRRLPLNPGLKIPHMGWNQVKTNSACVFFKGIPDNSSVYFCHSYYPHPADPALTAGTTEYGINFASAVWKNNVYGVQFHPEKSQDIGLAMIRNFVEHIRDNNADNPCYRPA